MKYLTETSFELDVKFKCPVILDIHKNKLLHIVCLFFIISECLTIKKKEKMKCQFGSGFWQQIGCLYQAQ